MTSDAKQYQQDINAYSDELQQQHRDKLQPYAARYYDFVGEDGQREANWLREHSAKPVYTVKGNCDAGDIAEEQVITLGGVRIFMTHGHAYAIALNSS